MSDRLLEEELERADGSLVVDCMVLIGEYPLDNLSLIAIGFALKGFQPLINLKISCARP